MGVCAVGAIVGVGWGGWVIWQTWTDAQALQPRPVAHSATTIHPAQRDALLLADRLLEDFPEDVQALFFRGQLLSQWEQAEEAQRCWQACVKRAPGFAPAYACLGRQALESGDFEKAVGPLRTAYQLDPKLPEVGLFLGQALRNLGKDAEAVGILEQVVATWPDSVPARLELGEAYLKTSAWEKARQCFQAVVDQKVPSTRAYLGLIAAYQRLGDMAKVRQYEAEFQPIRHKAHSTARELIKLDHSGPGLWRQLANWYCQAGQFYAGRGRLAQAEEWWRTAIATDNQQVRARRLLAGVLVQQQRVAEALELLKQVRQIEPDNPDHWLSSGGLCAALGRFDEAEAAFRQVVKLMPKRPDGHVALARLFLQTGQNLAEAVAAARTAVALEPTAPHYFLLSQACERTKDRAGALTAIGRAMELDPGNALYRTTWEQIR